MTTKTDMCKSGRHAMTPDNVYVDKRGYRECRECARERRRRGDMGAMPKTCARVGCHNTFQVKGNKTKYCSPQCANTEWKRRKHNHRPQIGVVCRNGHIRTPENTRIYGGKTRCLECQAAYSRRRYEVKKLDPVWMEQKRERDRRADQKRLQSFEVRLARAEYKRKHRASHKRNTIGKAA